MLIKPMHLLTEKETCLLSQAPIREAVLQIRFRTESSGSSILADGLHGKLQGRFSAPEVIRASQLIFKIDSDGPETIAAGNPEVRIAGYRLTSHDRRVSMLLEHDSFTFSMLPPYTSWADFRAEAKQVWELFRAELPPVTFSRLALRYINELAIPMSPGGAAPNFADYLKNPPVFPDRLGDEAEGFFSRIVINLSEIQVKAIFIQSFGAVEDGCAKVILDTDTFRSQVISLTDSEIWKVFDTLRDVKNTAFFESLTPKAMEMFK